jgi:hypothetical protein
MTHFSYTHRPESENRLLQFGVGPESAKPTPPPDVLKTAEEAPRGAEKQIIIPNGHDSKELNDNTRNSALVPQQKAAADVASAQNNRDKAQKDANDFRTKVVLARAAPKATS